MPYGFGIPITERLLPDDDVVMIAREEESGIVYDPEPTAAQLIALTVIRSDIVVVLVPNEIGGLLVEDGTWIHTRVIGTTDEVFMSKRRRVTTGQRLDFQTPGGEVRVGKVLVKALDTPKLTIGRRYLVFLRATDSGTLFPTHEPLLIENGKLSNWRVTEPGSSTIDPLHGLSFDEVVKEVRRPTARR
jgi:hypothetical protein